MHPRGERGVLGVEGGRVDRPLGQEARDVHVAVNLVGEERQRAQADAVAGLDHLEVVVGDRVVEHRRDAGAAAGGRAHPEHVVVAPLDVHRMVRHEGIEDDVGAGAPVEDVPHNVQVVYDQRLDDPGHRDDEILRATEMDDCREDVFVVVLFVVHLVVGVEQLVDDVGVVRGQRLAHLGPGVFGGDEPADLDQPVKGELIPLPDVPDRLVDLPQLLLGIVDQRGQPRALLPRHRVFKEDVAFFPHRARRAVEDM